MGAEEEETTITTPSSAVDVTLLVSVPWWCIVAILLTLLSLRCFNFQYLFAFVLVVHRSCYCGGVVV